MGEARRRETREAGRGLDGAAAVLQDEFNCRSRWSDARTRCAELDFIVTGDHAQERAYKVPSHRNVAERAPYMHAGQIGTLTEVIDHYDRAPDRRRRGRAGVAMTRTVDLVVAGTGPRVFAVAASAMRNRQRVLVLLATSDTRVARRLRRRLHVVACAHGGVFAVESHVQVVCVDGVGGVEAVVYRHRRTGRVSAVNAQAFCAP